MNTLGAFTRRSYVLRRYGTENTHRLSTDKDAIKELRGKRWNKNIVSLLALSMTCSFYL
jgi:hypothetical protein